MDKKTMVQLAVEYVVKNISKRKTSVKFTDIFKYVKQRMHLSDDEAFEVIGDLFTDLSLHPDLIDLGNNCFTLRKQASYDVLKSDNIDDDEDDVVDEDEDNGVDIVNIDDDNTNPTTLLKDIEEESEEF